jgi:hypothetical protein
VEDARDSVVERPLNSDHVEHLQLTAFASARGAASGRRNEMSAERILDTPGRRPLVNAAMDAYLEWREECAAVSDAYRRWADAGEADAEPAWRAYETALDREERASARYGDVVRHIGDFGAPVSPGETTHISRSRLTVWSP